MCDNCKTFFLTPAGWIESDVQPADAVGKDAFHEAEKMYQSSYWDGFRALSGDDELVERLRTEHGRNGGLRRERKTE